MARVISIEPLLLIRQELCFSRGLHNNKTMIVSHSHKFIFVKTRKTAGSAVEVALSRLCQEGDVFNILPQEYEKTRTDLKVKPTQSKFALPDGTKMQIAGHMPYNNILKQFGREVASYRVISCERNPFDKFISAIFYLGARRGLVEDEWPKTIRKSLTEGFLGPCSLLYSLYNISIADHILRYEHLEADLKILANEMGVGEKLYLSPRTSGDKRPEQSRDKELIKEIFKDPEIQRLLRNRFSGTFVGMGYHGILDDCPPFQPFEDRMGLREAWCRKLFDN